MIRVRRATLSDLKHLSENLRKEDIAELLAAGSPSPMAALANGYMHSLIPLVGVDENDVTQAMFGVVPSADASVGHVWLLGTDEMFKRPVRFLRESKRCVEHWNMQFPLLSNYVDCRNTLHVKWLSWLGFVFTSEVRGEGEGSLPFFQFVRFRDV